MRAQEFISDKLLVETGNAPYAYRKSEGSRLTHKLSGLSKYSNVLPNNPPETVTYTFVADGIEYEVVITSNSGNSTGRLISDLSFAAFVGSKAHINVLNTGDEVRVFSTVYRILKDYMNEYRPRVVRFVSSPATEKEARSRNKLYSRIVHTAAKLFPGYTGYGDVDSIRGIYYLVKKR
jgi:hypothetical protein